MPALRPELLADAVLLQGWDDADDTLLAAAMEANPDVVEARLSSLAQNPIMGSALTPVRRDLWERFFARFPERLTAVRDRANDLVDKIKNVRATDDREALTLALERLSDLALSHPDDQHVQLRLATGAVYAISDYGKVKDWHALEVCNRPVRALTAFLASSAWRA